MKFDLVIIGGGPAAIAGGVYAARKRLKTLVIAKEFGGQSIVSSEIFNWIGTPSIRGEDLAKSLKNHLEQYKGEYITIEEGLLVTKVAGTQGDFAITTNTEKVFTCSMVLVASGATRRRLKVSGTMEYDQKGLTYCATCDGPLFSGMDVVVVGGGNAGFESASQLLAYAKSVTLLDNGDMFKAEPITIEKVLSRKNMKAILHAETTEILGDKMVTGIKYKDTKTGEEQVLPVQGIFIEIGVVPNTQMVEDLVALDAVKHIQVDPWTQQTSEKGVWAAGDCTNGLYAQNNIAVGDAVKALEDIYVHFHK
ncbi:MAG: Alkyl hydroperoxide reductase [Parcubacteria group bacterium GW2011_GWC2_42_11]|nr:MAG: Alkyl hydroperoxide reductase [Parcubacteria group bacterium GW2011_GWC2_42_11]